MAANNKGSFQPDSDIHITFEDQQKINRFARLNAKLEDTKDELKNIQNELKNVDDAMEEMELADDGDQIPFMRGEVFVLQNPEDTKSALEEARDKMKSNISRLEATSAETRDTMSDLRTQLYAKFGNNINLEADED